MCIYLFLFFTFVSCSCLYVVSMSLCCEHVFLFSHVGIYIVLLILFSHIWRHKQIHILYVERCLQKIGRSDERLTLLHLYLHYTGQDEIIQKLNQTGLYQIVMYTLICHTIVILLSQGPYKFYMLSQWCNQQGQFLLLAASYSPTSLQ